MARKILIVCVDGLGPEYLEMAPTPNLDRMTREGFAATVSTVIPSVTNVNNVSIITGVPPAMHGITSNYWLDQRTGEEQLMESPDYLCRPTILQRAMGMSTALLTAKEKLLHLLDAGAIQFFQSADLPFTENQLQINFFIQAGLANRLQVLRRGGPGQETGRR